MKQLLLFFTICFTIIGCKSNTNEAQVKTKSCEEQIIEKDSVFGIIRNHAAEEKSMSVSIENYVAGLKSLDYSNCQESFYNAFYRHIEAWEAMIQVTDSYPDLRGEMHDVFKLLEQTKDSAKFSLALNKIWSTWSDVESQIKNE